MNEEKFDKTINKMNNWGCMVNKRIFAYFVIGNNYT